MTNQRYIYKNSSSRFRYSNWNLDLDLNIAKKNEEIVAINDSNALRILREITNNQTSEEKINEIKREIKKVKRKPYTKENVEKINKLYKQLDDLTVISEINSIVFEEIKDWNYINKKSKTIKLNGQKIRRVIGTSGGVKKNTVLFGDDKIVDDLNVRLNNGADLDEKYIPAKFEAYKALAFSGSTPVTNPKKILVIEDGKHDIFKDILLLSDDGNGGFKLTEEKNYKIERSFTDGCGMISPKLAKQWTIDMGFYKLDDNDEKNATYISSGFNIRNSFCKGMVFTFPYVEFAKEIAIPSGKDYFVKDAWGNLMDIREVEMIITTNMLKLWKSYKSVDHYLDCCNKNGYQFSVAKILPRKLEKSRNMNYQFLESYDFTDEDIQDLIKPTTDSIRGVLSDDYLKTLLFLKGCKISEEDFTGENFDYIKALMIDKRMLNDPYVRDRVKKMINKRINDSKKGVLEVMGSYHIVAGDLYALCQYMYNLPITGILKDNEFYAKSWLDMGVDKIVSYRAPMTVHNNIKVMPLINNKDVEKWFRYMKTCIVINAWDTTMDAMNGMDYDGDAVITTNNPILLKNTRSLPAIICEQKVGEKVKITEKKLRDANRKGFNNDVGGVTNKCTGMYDVLARFEKDAEEYNEMMYRIMCMQGYQQEVIDSIKGIIPKKVPKEWYDYKTVKINDKDDDATRKKKEYNLKLLSNKKPYFFIYNYKNVMRRYKKYLTSCNTNCIMQFGMTIEELEQFENKDKDMKNFLKYYQLKLPVSTEKSVMNRICWSLEKAYEQINNFDESIYNFDYTLLKSNIEYSQDNYDEIKKIYKLYKKDLQNFYIKSKKLDGFEMAANRQAFISKYEQLIYSVCNNELVVCDILLDMCYKHSSGKQFVWDICGDIIIQNLLKENDYFITIPKEVNHKTNTYWNGNYYIEDKIKYDNEDGECDE